ncbi:MAG: sigma-70 family RNA polymerase sigma factor [Planctomycetes bacterium]|nr:sigma-70 family RNA polymerase sigma factor [Planctomycetota bacterium]MCH7631799.1 sigma-70 family RNA polymerase sigma factor [Planctomycetota bacterium]
MAVDAGLQVYLRQINESPLLTADQEKELARTVRNGQSAAEQFGKGKITLAEREQTESEAGGARETMVKSNLRLVVNIAKKYARRGVALNDLINEGNLGLIRAVEGFDPDQNTRFSTYASWWIKQSIKRSLINSDKPIHIPAYMVEMISRFREAREQFVETESRQPTTEELAERLEMTVSKVNHIRNAVKAVSSPSHDTESASGLSLTESIADKRTPAPEDALFNESETTRIVGLLESLDDRESKILRLRYGLDGQEPMTLKQIGIEISLTRERVRQIECEALRKIKDHIVD